MAEKNSIVNKSIFGWALYDWANSAFATTVLAGFFPIFFKTFCSDGTPVTLSTARLGFTNSMGTILVCLMAPILGAIADSGSYKKRFLALFTAIGAVATASLVGISRGDWQSAVIVYGIAAVAFAACLCFYDSLLPGISTPQTVERISALGFSLGYLGGGLLFAVNVWMYLQPERFHLSGPLAAVRASFCVVGAWWLLFTLPLLIFVPEAPARIRQPFRAHALQGLRELRATFRNIRELKNLGAFLIAFFLYNDAVGTTMKMAVDYGVAIGFAPAKLIGALLLVQFIAFPTTLLFGKFIKPQHAKPAIFFCIAVYGGALVWAAQMQSAREFYVLAALVGSVQGGIQAISRAFFTRLIPSDKAGEFFGFYNLVGKFSGLAGPSVVGLVGYWTGEPRLGILSIIFFFAAGAIVLSRVRNPAHE